MCMCAYVCAFTCVVCVNVHSMIVYMYVDGRYIFVPCMLRSFSGGLFVCIQFGSIYVVAVSSIKRSL